MFNEVKRAILNAVANQKDKADISVGDGHVWVDSQYISVEYAMFNDGTTEFIVSTNTKHGGYNHGEDIWPLEKIVACLNEAVKLANYDRNNVVT